MIKMKNSYTRAFPLTLRCIAEKCYVFGRFGVHGSSKLKNGESMMTCADIPCQLLSHGEEKTFEVCYDEDPVSGLSAWWSAST